MNFPAPLRSFLLFALAANLVPTLARAQDVAADTPITDPTPPGVRIFADLAYVEGGTPTQTLDLYLPFPVPAKPIPVIVYLHGGGWQKGSKADGRRFAFRMVRQGYAVACANYRLSSEAQFPAQFEDVKVAVRWLRDYADRYRLDREHFGVVGVSSGGYLALMLGLARETHLFDNGGHLGQSSSVVAACDFFGPVDLLGLYEYGVEHHTPQADEVLRFLGSNPQLNPTQVRLANPLTYLASDSAPLLVIHGTEDTVIPPEQSRELYDAAAKLRSPIRLHLIHGAGHTGPAFASPEVNFMVDAFFDCFLKPSGHPWQDKPALLTESTAPKN